MRKSLRASDLPSKAHTVVCWRGQRLGRPLHAAVHTQFGVFHNRLVKGLAEPKKALDRQIARGVFCDGEKDCCLEWFTCSEEQRGAVRAELAQLEAQVAARAVR